MAKGRLQALAVTAAEAVERDGEDVLHALAAGVHVEEVHKVGLDLSGLLRRRPDVTSWRDLLERARDEYERQSIDELVAS